MQTNGYREEVQENTYQFFKYSPVKTGTMIGDRCGKNTSF